MTPVRPSKRPAWTPLLALALVCLSLAACAGLQTSDQYDPLLLSIDKYTIHDDNTYSGIEMYSEVTEDDLEDGLYKYVMRDMSGLVVYSKPNPDSAFSSALLFTDQDKMIVKIRLMQVFNTRERAMDFLQSMVSLILPKYTLLKSLNDDSSLYGVDLMDEEHYRAAFLARHPGDSYAKGMDLSIGYLIHPILREVRLGLKPMDDGSRYNVVLDYVSARYLNFVGGESDRRRRDIIERMQQY
ncbi:MAG: hypothetical protein KQJ78_24245 [Deltaproteobacteria bacterium]|nr:hypothetical protein [Deltaproteobacteria bacterium]